MPNISIDWQSDPQKALDAVRKLDAEVIKLKGTLQEVANRSRHHAQEHESLVHEATAEVGKLAAGYFTIEKGLEIINEALEHRVELDRESLDIIGRQAQAQTKLRMAMGSMTPEEMKEFGEQASQVGVATGIGAENFKNLLVDIQEASGVQLSKERQIETGTIAAQMHPQNLQDAAELGASLAKLQRLAGEGATEALGQLSALKEIGGFSGVDIFKRIVPAALAGQEFGDTFESASALISAVGMRTSARQAPTGYDKLAKALADFRPTKSLPDTQARLEALADSPELAARFFKNAKLPTGVEQAAKEIITGGPAAQQFRAVLSGLPHGAAAKERGEGLLRETVLDPKQATIAFHRQLQALTEEQHGSLAGARDAIARDALKMVLDTRGLPYLTRQVLGKEATLRETFRNENPRAILEDLLATLPEDLEKSAKDYGDDRMLSAAQDIAAIREAYRQGVARINAAEGLQRNQEQEHEAHGAHEEHAEPDRQMQENNELLRENNRQQGMMIGALKGLVNALLAPPPRVPPGMVNATVD